MKQLTITSLFFAFMYLLTSVYASAQGYYVDEWQQMQQQQQIQQLQNQQQQMIDQQRYQDLQRTLNSGPTGCVYVNGQAIC